MSSLAGYMEPEVVVEGGRNDAVLRYVGHLRGKGTPESVVLTAALNFNSNRGKTSGKLRFAGHVVVASN